MLIKGYGDRKLFANTIDDGELRDILTNAKLNRRGQYIADCPFCNKSGHFYISHDTQLWDCKKCKEAGNIYKLLKHLGKTYLLQGKTVTATETLMSIREMKAQNVQEDGLPLLPEVRLPAGFRTGVSGTYLTRDRGLTPSIVRRYGIGYSNALYKYKDYVIIPVRDNGAVRGFLGRYASKKVPKDRLRWSNSPGVNFAGLLYGFDEIEAGETETVVLVEGVFDKIKVDGVLRCYDSPDIKCCATFGKSISDDQIQKLVSKDIRNVVLLYDFDAIKEIKNYGLALENYFNTTITYTDSAKDIDECSDEEALSVFDRIQKPKEFNMNVIGKIR